RRGHGGPRCALWQDRRGIDVGHAHARRAAADGARRRPPGGGVARSDQRPSRLLRDQDHRHRADVPARSLRERIERRGRRGRRFGKSTSPDRVALAVDGAGRAVVGGRFFATTDFGGGPVTSPANNWQAFVAKYDGDGAPLWSRSLGGIYEEAVTSVAADAAG